MTAQTLYRIGRDPGQKPHLLHGEGLALCGAVPVNHTRFLIVARDEVPALSAASMGACVLCLAKAARREAAT